MLASQPVRMITVYYVFAEHGTTYGILVLGTSMGCTTAGFVELLAVLPFMETASPFEILGQCKLI